MVLHPPGHSFAGLQCFPNSLSLCAPTICRFILALCIVLLWGLLGLWLIVFVTQLNLFQSYCKLVLCWFVLGPALFLCCLCRLADVQLWPGKLLVGLCVLMFRVWVQARWVANAVVQMVYAIDLYSFVALTFPFYCIVRTVPQSIDGHTWGKKYFRPWLRNLWIPKRDPICSKNPEPQRASPVSVYHTPMYIFAWRWNFNQHQCGFMASTGTQGWRAGIRGPCDIFKVCCVIGEVCS